MAATASLAPPPCIPLTPDTQHPEPQGVLLYYKYVPLQGGDAEDVARFYTALCKELGLRGRIRVARDGVNVTVGGSITALQAHVAAVTDHVLLRGGDIDFKLAFSGGPRNAATRTETKMDRLVVRLCEELVTLGPLARHRADPRVSTAPHLTPEQFHSMLLRAVAGSAAAVGALVEGTAEEAAVAAAAVAAAAAAEATAAFQGAASGSKDVEARGDGGGGGGDDGGGVVAAAATAAAVIGHVDGGIKRGDTHGEGDGAEGGSGGGGNGGSDGVEDTWFGPDRGVPVVLLDARNIYETRIGRFHAGPSVPTLDPRTRCFSDLPAWLDAHEELLRNRTVLMYCTGGVRCERASAYLREKGPEFKWVFQLSGGIQRYLERFPDGGFFLGKNFLYDDRIAVGPQTVEQASPSPAPSNTSNTAAALVGRCQLCGCPWDDYGARLRCGRCRLLVLVCDKCCDSIQHNQHCQQQPRRDGREEGAEDMEEAEGGDDTHHPEQKLPPHSAEDKGTSSVLSGATVSLAQPPGTPAPALLPAADTPRGGGGAGGGPMINEAMQILCELCRAAAAAEPAVTAAGGDCGGCGSRDDAQAQASPGRVLPDDGDAAADVERPVASGSGGSGGRGCQAHPSRALSGTAAAVPSTDAADGHPGCHASCHLADAKNATGRHTAASSAQAAAGAAVTGTAAIAGAAVDTSMAETTARSDGLRRLRVLCLHGFRQTGKQFQGRTCALRKKLHDLAEFVFVDAPHTLPVFVKTGVSGGGSAGGATGAGITAGDAAGVGSSNKAQGEGIADGEGQDLAGPAACLGSVAVLGSSGVAAAESKIYCSGDLLTVPDGELGARQPSQGGDGGGNDEGDGTKQLSSKPAVVVPSPLAAKRAWLLPPDLYDGGAAAAVAAASGGIGRTAPGPRPAGDWQEAPSYVDELQYTRQTEGWRESLAAVQVAVRQLGPFDGVFGFSQGASLAAILCALQQQQRQQQQHCRQRSPSPSPPEQQQQHYPKFRQQCSVEPNADADAIPEADCDDDGDCDFGFRFAILASGFPSPLPQHRKLLAEVGPLELPSLHVYGTGDGGSGAHADRQISSRESETLATAFSCAGGRRRRLCHQSGHLIPATKSHAETFRAFLTHFLPGSTAPTATAVAAAALLQ